MSHDMLGARKRRLTHRAFVIPAHVSCLYLLCVRCRCIGFAVEIVETLPSSRVSRVRVPKSMTTRSFELYRVDSFCKVFPQVQGKLLNPRRRVESSDVTRSVDSIQNSSPIRLDGNTTGVTYESELRHRWISRITMQLPTKPVRNERIGHGSTFGAMDDEEVTSTACRSRTLLLRRKAC
jgi:hypothetical protein